MEESIHSMERDMQENERFDLCFITETRAYVTNYDLPLVFKAFDHGRD